MKLHILFEIIETLSDRIWLTTLLLLLNELHITSV